MDNATVKASLDILFTKIGRYRKRNDYERLMNFCARFRSLSPYNAVLIEIQRPGSKFVATEHTWSNRYNRKIKPGANPLIILEPFGPIDFVFDISMTEGDDSLLPKEIIDPFGYDPKVSPKVIEDYLNYLTKNAPFQGLHIGYDELGNRQGGYIKVQNDGRKQNAVINMRNGPVSIMLPYFHHIGINSVSENSVALRTLIHELAHFFCKHRPCPLWENVRSNLSTNEKEFEAESTAWLVCKRKGIEVPSEDYLKVYLNAKDEIPNISIDAITTAVYQIEQMMDHSMGIKAGLLYKRIYDVKAQVDTIYRNAKSEPKIQFPKK